MHRPSQLGALPRSLALSVGLLVSALAGCKGDEGPGEKQAPPPAPVEIAKAELGELSEEWVFSGEIRSLRSAELALGAGGEVVMLEVREGDRVDAGTLLIEIDKRMASARLSAAVSSRRESERELEQARREAERAKRLGAEVIAQEQIEQEESRADTLEARKRRMAAEIRAARAQLSDYKLIAPYDGVIAARYVDVGQWVDPGETVLEIVAIDEVEILVDVRPELVAHVQVGGEATLRPAGGVGGRSTGEQATAKAEVVGVVPSLNPATRTIRVRLRTNEARPWLLPGAPVDVGFPVRFEAGAASEGQAQAVIVPRDALVLGAVDIRVIEVVDGKATPVQIELRASAGDRALVVGEGLEPGDAVVTRGNERLRPGQPVRVLEAEPAAGEGEEPAS